MKAHGDADEECWELNGQPGQALCNFCQRLMLKSTGGGGGGGGEQK